MLKSMTAYARAENQTATYRIATEIRSYNSRNLDLALHLARPYLSLEERIKTLVASYIHRGRLEMRVDIQPLSEHEQSFEIDWSRAKAYCEALQHLKKELALRGEVSLDLLTSVGGILKTAENPQDMGTVWPVLADAVVGVVSRS